MDTINRVLAEKIEALEAEIKVLKEQVENDQRILSSYHIKTMLNGHYAIIYDTPNDKTEIRFQLYDNGLFQTHIVPENNSDNEKNSQ